MIYFLHNPQTGRVEQSPNLESFSGLDRSTFEKLKIMRCFDKDFFAYHGSSVYRIISG